MFVNRQSDRHTTKATNRLFWVSGFYGTIYIKFEVKALHMRIYANTTWLWNVHCDNPVNVIMLSTVATFAVNTDLWTSWTLAWCNNIRNRMQVNKKLLTNQMWENRLTRNSPWGQSFMIVQCDHLHWVPPSWWRIDWLGSLHPPSWWRTDWMPGMSGCHWLQDSLATGAVNRSKKSLKKVLWKGRGVWRERYREWPERRREGGRMGQGEEWKEELWEGWKQTH